MFSISKIKSLAVGLLLFCTILLQISEAASNLSDWSTDINFIGAVSLAHKDKIDKDLKEVVVAVIDTGIDFDHQELKNKIVTFEEGRFINANKLNFGRDFSPGTLSFKRPFDENGHGTHIASIIANIAPNAKILPIKYYNSEASEKQNLEATVEAIKFAISAGVKIINYSSGGSGMSKLESEVIKLANEKNVLLVAAAGNFGENIDKAGLEYYPASYQQQNIISVINHGPNFKLHNTSNYGLQNADISAPGTKILGALPNNRYGTLTGTSQSTAFVSGTAALISGLSSKLTHLKIKNIILNSTDSVSHFKNKCSSSGALNIEKSLDFAKKVLKRNFASTHTSKD